LQADNVRLGREVERLRKRNAQLHKENDKLKALLEAAHRAGKRQAAPFSKGPPKSDPKRPGRRPGADYGKKAHRPVPSHVDRVVESLLPLCCPDCSGEVEETEVAVQYQEDIPPVRPTVTQFNVHVGHCRRCHRRVQGRHPEQTSDALGAAAAQLGPRAVALAADLSKGIGTPLKKMSALYMTAFTLSVTPGGLCLALHRLARAARPTYQALVLQVRRAPVVAPDETGWKVGGWLWWLWVFVTKTITIYAILPGRGFEQAASVLGEEFSGTLERDGWAPYRRFIHSTFQTCLRHISNRCERLLETAQRGAARLPHAVLRIVGDAFELRDRRDRGEVSPHGLAVATGRLQARTDRLLAWNPTDESNRRLVLHMRKERDGMFRFLKDPEVEATNWRAEQAIRPAVVTRKICGGNRTPRGGFTQETLATVLVTSRQQGLHPYPLLEALLRSPAPTVIKELLAGGARGP
jgi:transposase